MEIEKIILNGVTQPQKVKHHTPFLRGTDLHLLDCYLGTPVVISKQERNHCEGEKGS